MEDQIDPEIAGSTVSSQSNSRKEHFSTIEKPADSSGSQDFLEGGSALTLNNSQN